MTADAQRNARGFTLIEVLTVLAIVAALASVSILALGGLRKRGTFASATGDLIVGLRQTRAIAYGRGTSTVFVVDTAGGRWWGIEDLNGAFSLSTFNPNSPAPSGYNLLASGTLPTGVTFTGATNGFGGPLPAPYIGVPASLSATPAPNLAYCSFCQTAGTPGPGFGSIQFQANGGATFNSGPAAVGQSMTLQGDTGTSLSQILTVAVIGRTGTAETFQP